MLLLNTGDTFKPRRDGGENVAFRVRLPAFRLKYDRFNRAGHAARFAQVSSE